MNKQQIKGQWDSGKGIVKENVGRATENKPLEGEGLTDQVKGKFEKGMGNLKNKAEEAVDSNRRKSA